GEPPIDIRRGAANLHDVAMPDLVGERMNLNNGRIATAYHALFQVAELIVHFDQGRVDSEPRQNARGREQARVNGVLESGRPAFLRMYVEERRLVDLGFDQHVPQVGNLHESLTFADRLALGNDPLLRAAA